jgi:hypothetical protein
MPLRIFCVLLLAASVLAGCHSAVFQTAKIREGASVTAGVTRTDAADVAGVSDYSVSIKGEIGREAHRYRFGYSLGLTFISPFKKRQRDFLGESDTDVGTYPNEWAGVYPEFKLQLPRRLPVDLALDARLMGYLPERISAIASYDFADYGALYGSFSYVATLEGLVCLGSEIRLTRALSILVESTAWLANHRYPDGYSGPGRARPITFGLALSYHLPRSAAPIDPRTAMASHPTGP